MALRTYTKITRKGQITVPAEVRRKLGLKAGDRITVKVEEGSNEATIERTGSIVDATYGIAKTDRVFTVEEEKAIAAERRAEYLAEKYSVKP